MKPVIVVRHTPSQKAERKRRTESMEFSLDLLGADRPKKSSIRYEMMRKGQIVL